MKGKRYKFMKGYNRNTIKVSFEEPEFYINEKKRTVTCKLEGFLNGPQDNSSWTEDIDFPSSTLTVSSTARCHKDDTFDIERGKRIALSKAENEIYCMATLEVSKVAEKLDFLRNACNDFAAKSIRCQAHNIDYIDSLSMPAHPRYNNNVLPRKKGVEVVHIK